MLTLSQSSRGGVRFCCFSLVYLVHFLTIVNNLPIFQRTSSHALVSVVSMRSDTVRGVRFGCIIVASCICLQSYKL